MSDHIDTDPTDAGLAVIVLAAGQGTRMRSRTPKVLHPLAGIPLLGHVLRTAADLGPARVVVVVRHERDAVAAAVADLAPAAVVVDQDDVPGTGRAVQQGLGALEGFQGDVLVLSGDVPLIEVDTLSELVAAHRARAASVTVLTARPADPTGYGRVLRDASGDVARIVEQKDATDHELQSDEINAGVYVFRATALAGYLAAVTRDNAQQEMYLTDVVALARRDGDRVTAVIAPDAATALGVNDRVQLAEAARLLNARIVQRWQRAGVTVQDPGTTWIDAAVQLDEDVTILPGTQLLRATVVARGATVGPDTTLSDCEVGEEATIRRTDGTLAVIGARASVGPFAYLRPGTVLGEGGKIGTYVETKNSRIGAGSKVPHLSYIGDTDIGVNVNLGAGAITANYDDISKHRTVIGDEVHSGSHNVFVAPVRIGDGAKTGAGAIVRKDVPPGALALTVAPQRNVEGWVEKNRPGTGAAAAAERARSTQESGDGTQRQEG